MTQENASKKTPKWLAVSDESAVISMVGAVEIGGVKVDKLTMRAPTVRDQRAANATAKGDYEQIEINMLCSLLMATEPEIAALSLRNYNRLQAGYFRLVEEDEL
ncbi:phage tail assembly protein [Pseudomonas sp. B21-015]|uniref:phage tail assembly protein n=1 Tax=Pseudomonas sp. B21-015 TaxID=2895473 RepID=UPI00215ED1F9|nr:phage tail assembly protein [Pseudomonas sp. B21-015]UVM48558.1 phage tail assembly protein [Pseudomonas sp. B21-015]